MDDETDFAEYADASWRTLVRSAVFLGCTLPDAEDLAQTTLVRCYTAWPRVAAAENRDAYVYRILVNALRDVHRKQRWRERPTAVLPDAAVDDATDSYDTVDSIHRALAALSRGNRDVVVLRYFTQLTERQTAQALGIAPGTVKSRLSRALAQLAGSHHLSDLDDLTDLTSDPTSDPSRSSHE